MQISTRFVNLLLCVLLLPLVSLRAQSILNPTDTVKTYNSASPPAQPPYGTIGKWVRTVKLTWNTTGYKCYIYKNNPFRLYFPKSYNPTANDGKKYPMLIFYHGVGEAGATIYDNELSLYHGGQFFAQSVDNGTFDGYILVMQTSGGWGPSQYGPIKELIDYMVANNKLDPFRVMNNGLSGGGGGTWNMFLSYPTYIAGLIPMSSVDVAYTVDSMVQKLKFTPIWNIHGGLDGNPTPYTAAQVNTALQAAGANYVDLNMTTQAHDTWDSTWSMPAFWPFINKAYSSNPWVLFGRTQFCPNQAFSVTIGVVKGFDAYQWRKDGIVIPGATSNTITATALGSYDCRVERNGIWSNWSPVPVVLSIKQPTQTPAITVNGLMSKVVPAPDGNTGVSLMEPAGYTSYSWFKQPSTVVIDTMSVHNNATAGYYRASVTEKYGCSTIASPPFKVIDANGPNKPDPASGVSVTPVSLTSLLVNWSQNPSPAFNETNFEVYQATHSGGPYKLVTITGPDVTKDSLTGLTPGTKYYYIVRAVDTSGAAASSAEASGSTIADTIPPTAPGNLSVTGTTRSSVSLAWTASKDNIGVTEYDVYVNGVKQYVVSKDSVRFTVFGLTYQQTYAFVVKAVDSAGNNSAPSNQVVAQPINGNVTWKYYPYAAAPSQLPDFSTMTPTLTGIAPNITLSPATQAINYSFLFEGYLHVTKAGAYSFSTTSDDGSKLYIGSLNATGSAYSYTAFPVVNNDGLHGTKTIYSGTMNLQVGVYPIAVTYLQGTGAAILNVSWKMPGAAGYTALPDSVFGDLAIPGGVAPAAPSNVMATANAYNRVTLNWTDNSSNETGFEIWRSTSGSTGFNTIGTTGPNVTSFVDSTVAASTHYYYKVRAIGQYGGSNLASNYTEAEWKFNNSFADSTGNGHLLTAVGSPTFDAGTKAEGAYSVKLNGSSQAMTIPPTNGFLQENYTQRTVSLWLKSSSTAGANRVIFDIGGADNGLGLVLNNTTLIAAAASNSVVGVTYTTYNSSDWNFITVVYNGDSLQLYVNGVLAASNYNLPFHSILTTTDLSSIGVTNGGYAYTNAYHDNGQRFGGWIDDFGVYSTAFDATTINTIKNFTYKQSNVTTPALPAVPAVPSGLKATAVSASQIDLSWSNAATNADNIQIYRSAADSNSYVLWRVLPATATSFVDSGLFADALYYYKIRAINSGGNSAFTPAVSARTLDNPPVITKLGNQQARYGTTTTIALSATHAGGGTLTFSASNLPAFVTLTDNGDGSGALVVSPAVSDQGTYTGLKVKVTDVFGMSDSTSFNLLVNDAWTPTIDSVVNYTLPEGDTLSVRLKAQEHNTADTLKLSVSGAPAGSVLTATGNGLATLALHPGFSAAGVYTVQVTVNDNNGLSAVRTFTVTVTNKSPDTKIYARMAYQDSSALGLPWNALMGTTTTGLKDSSGTSTAVGLAFSPSTWWNTFNGGSSTGNNSGVYPDHVLQDYLWWGSIYGGPDVLNGTYSGLDTSSMYDLTFFANSVYNGVSDNGTTTYTVGTQTVQLYVQDNKTNTVTIPNIKPAAAGTIAFSMGKAAGTALGYLNALVLTKHYDDGTRPAGPGLLTAQDVAAGVGLNWADSAYNALGYQIWRAPASTGVFSMIGTVAGNAANVYTDSSVAGNTRYLYTVRAYNNHGYSGYSDTANVITGNHPPVVNPIGDVTIKNNQEDTFTVRTTAAPGTQLTLTATGLPAFATFNDNGDGTGLVTIAPSAGTVGFYPNITITATDAMDSSGSATFNLAVTEPNVTSVYVNFTGGAATPKPWNTLQTPPYSGTAMTGLKDDAGNATALSLTLTDGFYWFDNSGRYTGNSDGLYPDVVMRNGLYEPTTTVRHIKVAGLSKAKKYNFVFFNSQSDGTNGLTKFTIGDQTVSLQASYNINKTVSINGLVPDTSGAFTISVAKDSAAVNAYLGAVVIQAYDTAKDLILNPADLRVTQHSMHAASLQWQDRSANESAFELWRSDVSGQFTKIATLPAGTTTYSDAALSPNSTYYYTVRAYAGADTSDYSNVAAVTTAANMVFINFNDVDTAPRPWNNLNALPQKGQVWNNFMDSTGTGTSISMTQTTDFAGLNSLGYVTGNNSGVYPDAVIAEEYVAFQGDPGSLQFSGLNLGQAYDLTFFGSENLYGDNTSAYVVNGDTVFLNAMYNSKGTVTMHGVRPDNNGRLNLTLLAYGQASGGGWLNSVVLSGYTPYTGAAPTPPNALPGGKDTSTSSTTPPPNQTAAHDSIVMVYPNPFKQAFTLRVPSSTYGAKMKVSIVDALGHQVYVKEFDNLVAGANYLPIEANNNFTKAGVYFLQVTNKDGQLIRTFTILKE